MSRAVLASFAFALVACSPGTETKSQPGPSPATRPATQLGEPATSEPAEAQGRVVEPEFGYQTPPPEVQKIVEAPGTPRVSLSSDGRTMLMAEAPRLPDIAVLAEPMLGLAGERINPRTNERRRTRFYTQLSLIDVETAERREVTGLPEGAQLSAGDWSPNGKSIALTNTVEAGVELWLVEVESAKARRLLGPELNATFGTGITWLSGSDELIVSRIPVSRGPAPIASPVAQGPLVDETSGRSATNRTYRDLLETPLDDALFAHHFSSELVVVGLDGKTRALADSAGDLGGVGVFADVDPSPDGQWLLVERLVDPFSHSVPWYRFPHRYELWPLSSDAGSAPVVFAELPAAEEVPIQGVPTGPRALGWQPLEPATLIWAEALDGGDPRAEAEHRDRLLRLAGPFTGKSAHEQGEEFTRLTHRYSGRNWLDQPGRYLVREYDRDRKWITTHLREMPKAGQAPGPGRVFFDRSIHDVYADPGDFVMHNRPDDTWVVRVEGEGEDAAVFLDGAGASPEGDRPFLDRLALAEGAEPERLFEAPKEGWASFSGFVGDGVETMVVRREGPHDPPDWFREGVGKPEDAVALTELPHPHPELDGMGKELLTYERGDGVPLNATLYTPPGFVPGESEPLPMIIWAYPREYVDKDTAGQVRAAPTRFTRLGGTSATMFLTQGYAVMFAAMPVVGDPETMNDTLLEQLELGAKAAIDEAVKRGVADRERVGVGGHSYGAFMVANLLAHTDLFKAGIARSGAYNRSLTPFGFQSERRTLWDATEAYVEVSPLFAAASLDEPILLIHGEIDDNSGTFPIQTQRLFHALQGLGGTSRKVVLPHEAHGYRARESVLHTLWESFEWFDRHVKGAKVDPGASAN